MNNLEELYLDNNLIEDVLLARIGELRKLRLLVLKGNKFYNSLPKELFGLPLLELVDISYNNFSGELPIALFSHRKLKYFDAIHNKFTGKVPSNINSSKLWFCNLGDTLLEGSISDDIIIPLFSFSNTSVSGNLIRSRESAPQDAIAIFYISTVDRLRVRDEPSQDSKVIGFLQKDELIEYLWVTSDEDIILMDEKQYKGRWVKIRNYSGVEGWVWKGFLKEVRSRRSRYSEGHVLVLGSEWEVIENDNIIRLRTEDLISLPVERNYIFVFNIQNATDESFFGDIIFFKGGTHEYFPIREIPHVFIGAKKIVQLRMNVFLTSDYYNGFYIDFRAFEQNEYIRVTGGVSNN